MSDAKRLRHRVIHPEPFIDAIMILCGLMENTSQPKSGSSATYIALLIIPATLLGK